MDLQAARESRVGWLDVRSRPEDAPPAQPVDDQRRGQVAAVGVHGEPGAPLDLRGLERARALRLRPQERADAAVVERRERPRQPPAQRPPGDVDDEVRERLLDGVHQVEVLEPLRRRRTGRRLALADLVAVDHQHPRAGPRKLPRDG